MKILLGSGEGIDAEVTDNKGAILLIQAVRRGGDTVVDMILLLDRQ